jgi:D-glycero-D-manno-heptose 1,7-bisphosphate phosphatase
MKLIILDRDGVINRDSDNFIKSPAEWIPISGSLEAITRLYQAGYRIVLATNQSGIGRGLFDIETLNRIHTKMHERLAELGGFIEAIFFCPHGPDDNCDCRKPKAGLLEDIGRRLKVDLTGVPAVGDSLRDLQAARAVGACPVLVRTGKGKRTVAAGEGLEGVAVFDDLADYTEHLLQEDAKQQAS